jgi:hypothetical protein
MFSTIFESGVGSDGSPIAQAIEKATDPMLLHADWAKNLEVCDMVNATPEGQTSAVKMLRKQLKSDNAKTVRLALELADACVKNCSARLHFAVASKAFMADVAALADGRKGWEVKEESLKCIQQWGLSFKDKRDVLPVFYDTYISLKTKGVAFPKEEQSAPVFTPPPAMFDEPDSSQPGVEDAAELAKLNDDLNALDEKIKLCREIIPQSPGVCTSCELVAPKRPFLL